MTPERWQEVKKVLAAALEREQRERGAYLDQACTDPLLRREIESLIAALEQGPNSFLEQPIFGTTELESGRSLGPYQIIKRIGAGGMGEVYRARDTRLDRTVAIKVLHVHLADKPELRERFELEAKIIASLSHPHICSLYDVGHQENLDFLVMEYLEGQTLSERLKKGPLPLDEVLQRSIEIADALDKAHRKGITHRDLKPGNIMLTKSGAKLLDFGLAKLGREASLKDLPKSEALTAPGTILGTLHYMAPEQLEGKEADARTDVFAFGAVIHEMATGKKAFGGGSQASIISAIMSSDPPPVSALEPMAPDALDRVVKSCLAKDPDDRWQSLHDLEQELKWLAAGVLTSEGLRTGRKQRISRSLVWLVLALAGIIAVWALVAQRRPALQPIDVAVVLPQMDRLAFGPTPVLALSPDGSRLAYVANHGGTSQLYLRSLDRFETNAISDTEGATSPFFSPDGAFLGFFAAGKLKKVSLNGGASFSLCNAPDNRGATWGPGDSIIFTPSSAAGLFQVSAAGGTPKPLTVLDHSSKELSHRWPEILPGGKALIFTIWTGGSFDDARIAFQSLETGKRHTLIEGGTFARFVPPDYLVYSRAGGLFAVRIDTGRGEITGPAVPVLQGISTYPGTGTADFSTAHGTLTYVPGGPRFEARTLLWVDRNGLGRAIPAPPRAYSSPRLSPDSRWLLLGIQGNAAGVWLYEQERGSLTRLIESGGNTFPIWEPDSKHVTFVSPLTGSLNLRWMATDGSAAGDRLATSENTQLPGSWSPDGRVLAFSEQNPTTGWDIWTLKRDGEQKVQPLLQTPSDEGGALFSPDGRFLAYVSNESGREEVYVCSFPGLGAKWQISTEGGIEPMWARNGRELFYRVGDKMMAARIETRPTFTASRPKILFEGHYEKGEVSFFPDYDVSSDGQRFLMVKAEEEQAATQINVVLNWLAELKEKSSTKIK